MTASAPPEGRLQQTWWRAPDPRARWRALHDPARLAEALRWLADGEGSEPDPIGIAATSVDLLDDTLPEEQDQRDALLRSLWCHHDRYRVETGRCVGVPPRLWAGLLDRYGVTSETGCCAWVEGAEEEGLFHQGVRRTRCTEWWGHPAAPGATYDEQLWAWGLVETGEFPAGVDLLSVLSPRLVWRSTGAGWQVQPGLQERLVDGAGLLEPPRVEEGPGYLLACIVDAIVELARGQRMTGRDRSVLWGSMLLPLLASSSLVEGAAPRGRALELPPDYLQMLPFYLLHPRVQVALACLDRVSSLLLASPPGLAEVITLATGEAVGEHEVEARTGELLQRIFERALARRAAAQWSSGFGFRMFRALLRALDPERPAELAVAFDRAVHGAPGEIEEQEIAVGPLAERLREAMGTALWYPGRPRYDDGPVAEQLLDLVWLRWTDATFLG